MASVRLSVVSSLLLCFIFLSVVTTDDLCCEPWRLERDSNESIFIGFTNGTYPGRYTSLIWRWQATNITGEWETTLWISHVSEKILGSMAFRDEESKIYNSIMWCLDGGNLTWSSQGGKLTDVNWSVSVCNIANWSYETNATGDWTFKLGDILLERPAGEKIINHNENDEALLDLENSIGFHRKKRHHGILESHHTDPERSWRIVREVLDRVFGNSPEGWIVGPISNLLSLIATAITAGGLGGGGGAINNGGEVPATPSTPPEVETFDPTSSSIINMKRNGIAAKA